MTVPTNVISTDADLYNLLADIIGEDLDQGVAARKLSSAKNELERNEKLEILQAEDTSKTNASGDIYTSMKALPDDWRQMLELYVGTTLYSPVAFKRRVSFRNSSRRYYIDHKNSQFAICGTGSGQTIRQVYLIKTDDITEATITAASTTITWPAEYREVIAWHAAQILSSGTDTAADDLSFRMSVAQRNRYEELMRSLRSWNHDLVLNSMDNRTGMDEEADEESIADEVLPYL